MQLVNRSIKELCVCPVIEKIFFHFCDKGERLIFLFLYEIISISTESEKLNTNCYSHYPHIK